MTGHSPAPAMERNKNLLRNSDDPLEFLSELNPEIPKGVAEVFHLGLELLPEDRKGIAFELKELCSGRKLRNIENIPNGLHESFERR
jgi:hypothetical protein